VILLSNGDKQLHPFPDHVAVAVIELLGLPEIFEMINLVIGETGPGLENGIL
jgi:hypothetical protein